MELHLNIIGCILVVLAIAHAAFPRYFAWKEEFSQLSTINREMMYVHTFFIALVLLLMGMLCIVSAEALVSTPLGKQICLGIGIFWAARLLIQIFGYSSTLWKGKRFETTIHILFLFLWTYLSAVFVTIALA